MINPVIVTSGDPSSISSIITIKAWKELKNKSIPFVVYSNINLFQQALLYYNISIPLHEVTDIKDVNKVFPNALPVYNIFSDIPNIEFGNPNIGKEFNAKFALTSINKALEHTIQKIGCALCTNPVDKDIINSYTISKLKLPFLGHTEYMFKYDKAPISNNPVMMLCSENPKLKVVTLTTHIPLQDVPSALTQQKIIDTTNTTQQFLKKYYKISNPKILLTGLNPHAGENGLLGTQEQDIILPAIQKLKQLGIACDGPISADTAFLPKYLNAYDAIVGMYHDQVLSPFKALCFETGIDVTMGLSFVRTSVAHGTAFNIAKNKDSISATSLIEAIKLAFKLTNS